MKTNLLRSIILGMSAVSAAANAVDIVLTPPAGGGVAITNAAGNVNRFRVADDGAITMPGVSAAPGPFTGLCVEIATGRVGTCALGGGPSNAFVLGGNAFGAAATLGTTDNQALSLLVNNAPALRLFPGATSTNLVGGWSENAVASGAAAATIAGGGAAGQADPVLAYDCFGPCANEVTDYGGTVGGGVANRAGNAAGTATDRAFATVAGGFGNEAAGGLSVIAGGYNNVASGEFSFVGSGATHVASGQYSAIAGGFHNLAPGMRSAIGGGSSNQANGSNAAVSGGFGNIASGDYSAVGGGEGNQASGEYSTAPGGNNNIARGQYSFAAGKQAFALSSINGDPHDGAFVWADSSSNFAFHSTGAHEFSARATGGVRLVTAIDGTGAAVQTYRFGPTASVMPNIRGVTTGLADAIPVVIDSAGQLGTLSSSRHVKTDLADMGDASDVLMRLRPVTFRYNAHAASGQAALQYGLVAEEVDEVAPQLVAHSSEGGIETVKYHFLAPMLLNEVQRQRRTIEELRSELEAIRQALGVR